MLIVETVLLPSSERAVGVGRRSFELEGAGEARSKRPTPFRTTLPREIQERKGEPALWWSDLLLGGTRRELIERCGALGGMGGALGRLCAFLRDSYISFVSRCIAMCGVLFVLLEKTMGIYDYRASD
jgi:hypothetical protein